MMSIQQTATALLQGYKISINEVVCDILEIEMYLKCPNHEDPYVHGAPEQKLQWVWYFHRHLNGTYKNGTFKGLDLTLGDGISYYGVLIRSIRSPDHGVICGPCNTVNFILQRYGVESIAELTNNTSLHVLNNFRQLHLVPVTPTVIPIYHGPRIGLNPHKATYEWHQAYYRYTSNPSVMKKGKQLLYPIKL